VSQLLNKMKEAKDYISSKHSKKPAIGVVLGSGLGDFVNQLTDTTIIDYQDIPHFPKTTVDGHAGKLVIGKLGQHEVILMQGRYHYYEGYSMQEVTFPIRVFRLLGVKTLIVTNACGGLNPNFSPGDLMLITDHINFTGDNPLIGKNIDELGPRFPDMSRAYDPELQNHVKHAADRLNIPLQQGVYVAISGPSYMTKAELKMLRYIGGDAVGMSTVPEVIVANHMQMKVIGLSCITDMAIPEELKPLTHEEVIRVANETKPAFERLLKEIILTLEIESA